MSKTLLKIKLAFVTVLFTANVFAIGDLMLTAQQRAKIDLLRVKGGGSTTSDVLKTNKLKFNGFFFKSRDGQHKGKVWINGRQVQQFETTEGITLLGVNENDGTAELILPTTSSRFPLKPGQQLLIDEGEIIDAYQQ